MTIGERLAGLKKGEITVDDVDELFDGVQQDEATALKSVRHLTTIVEEYPELIDRRRERIVPAIDSVESHSVKRGLYMVARTVVERDAEFSRNLFRLVEEDIIIPDSPIRLDIYGLLREAAENGVEIPEEIVDNLVSGIVIAPKSTPGASALDAFTSILESHPGQVERGLLILVDFVESDYEEISTQAVRSLVYLALNGYVPESANREGLALMIEENFETAGVPPEEARSALDKLR